MIHVKTAATMTAAPRRTTGCGRRKRGNLPQILLRRERYLNHLAEFHGRAVQRGRAIAPRLRRGDRLLVVVRYGRRAHDRRGDLASLVDDDFHRPDHLSRYDAG